MYHIYRSGIITLFKRFLRQHW